MSNLKKYTALFISLLMFFNATSCRPEKADTPTGEQESKTLSDTQEKNAPLSTSGKTLPDSDSDGTLFQNTPSHISKIYDDNFSVDADVHVPDVNKADILSAKRMSYDEQKMVSVLFAGENPQKEIDTTGDSVSYRDDNATLIFNPGIIYYYTEDWQYYKFPTEDFGANYEVYSGSPKLGEVYKEESLSFMTKEEAIESAASVLREFSIDITDDVEIYAIDSASMQAQQDQKIKKMSDYMKSMGITPADDKSANDPTSGYQTKDKFTSDDDFYRIYFKVQQNDIPVTQKTYTIQANERAMEGSIVEVSLSKNGIIKLYCSSIYQQQSVDETVTSLLSAEEALQKAMDINNQIISTDKVTVSSIDFEYVPTPYNDNYEEVKLVPAWSLTLVCENTMPSKDGEAESYTRMLFINAITGEEIQ